MPDGSSPEFFFHAVDFTGPIELKIHMGYDPSIVDVYRIVLSGDPFTPSTFAGFAYQGRVLQNFEEFLVTEGALSQFFGIHYLGDGTIELFAAPEPGSAILLLGGSLCLTALRRRSASRVR